MGHSTDLKLAGAASPASPPAEDVARVIDAVADHFTTVRPSEPLDPNALLISVSAEAYKVCGQSIGGDAAHLSRVCLAVAPEQPADFTRGEYALRLRRTADTPAGVAEGAAR